MKTKIYFLCYLLLLFHCGILFSLSAQDKYLITDMLNNQTYNYSTKYIELKNSKWNFYNEIDLEYPVLTDLVDSIVQKKLNIRLKQILVDQIETDSFRINLFLNLKQSLSTYFTIYNKVKDQLGIYWANESKFTPDIKGVDFMFLSCFKSTVTFVAVFRYGTQYQQYILDEDLNYFQVYYFNLVNGKEYHPNDVFKKLSEKEISSIIENAVQNNIKTIDIKLEENESDFYNDIENPSAQKEKKLVNFSLTKNGFPYLKAFSMAYYIPAWSPCTQNIYGLDAEVRLTFDEIRKHLNPQGPFASLIKYSLVDSTWLKNQNNPLFISQSYNFTPQFSVYDECPYVITEKLKTITIKRLTKVKNDEGNWEDKGFLIKQLEYLQNGYIKEIRNYESDGRIYNTQAFNFDYMNNLIKKSTFKNGKLEESDDFTYDINGNLISQCKTDEDKVPQKTFYYYSNNFILEEHYGYYGYNGRIENNYRKKIINNSGLVTNSLFITITYHSSTYEIENKFDINGRLLLSYNKNNQPSTSHYVYDKNGNLMTYEYDNGRLMYEYKYDENNRLIRETRYDSKRIISVKKAEYNTEDRIVKIEVSDSNNNSETQVYLITYEYW